MNDKIADTINRLYTAGLSKKESVSMYGSKMVFSILELLKREGYVTDVSKKGKGVESISVTLKYSGDTPAINGVKRISKSSKRMYLNVSGIHPVKSGKGVLVISTPKGILTDKEARKAHVGGEPLFTIW
ncbi:MAG: 30S ribosomal protein S8 [Candidatus Paceibacterota bacterium]